VGGPVESQTALCLAAVRTGENPAALTGLVGVRGPVALVDLDGDPVPLTSRLRGLRVFAGYSGWDAGQLAAEIGRGDWVVVPAPPVAAPPAPPDPLAPPRAPPPPAAPAPPSPPSVTAPFTEPPVSLASTRPWPFTSPACTAGRLTTVVTVVGAGAGARAGA